MRSPHSIAAPLAVLHRSTPRARFHNWDTITEPRESNFYPCHPRLGKLVRQPFDACDSSKKKKKIIIAEAHNNPLREAFGGGGAKCTASHSEARKKKKIARFSLFGLKKGANLKGGQQREAFVLSLRLHPQSRVPISYCFRPKQRQRSRRSKQMTIKLSNKHRPAMFPNADCGRARRESESGGSRIVSSHFDAELKKLAKKEKRKRQRGGIKRLPRKERKGGRVGVRKRERREEQKKKKLCVKRWNTCTRLLFH